MTIVRTETNFDGTKNWTNEFSEEDKQAFYSLQFWNMFYCFKAQQEDEYRKIRKKFVEQLGAEKVRKLEMEFPKSKDYIEMLTIYGVPNSYINRNEPQNH